MIHSTYKHRKIQVFATSVLFILMMIACSVDETPSVATDDAEMPSQEGWNSEIYLSKAGRKQAIVKYGHMQKFDQKAVYIFDEGVEVDFYNKDGSHSSHLTADSGEYHEATEDVFGMGNVVVESDSGITLHTERLRWDHRREKILSDTLVMLTSPNADTLYGVGFESNADLSRRVILKPRGISQGSIDFDKIENSFEKSETDSTTIQADSTMSDSLR